VLKVKDGTTILLGGLVREDKVKNTSGFPVLSRIPVLGVFFGSRADLKKKTEMIVFLTPHIIAGNENFDKKELQGSEAVKLLPEASAVSVSAVKQEQMPHIDIQEKLKGPKEY
jgi:type II secretory pathway component GspD/PulD (secretin)